MGWPGCTFINDQESSWSTYESICLVVENEEEFTIMGMFDQFTLLALAVATITADVDVNGTISSSPLLTTSSTYTDYIISVRIRKLAQVRKLFRKEENESTIVKVPLFLASLKHRSVTELREHFHEMEGPKQRETPVCTIESSIMKQEWTPKRIKRLRQDQGKNYKNADACTTQAIQKRREWHTIDIPVYDKTFHQRGNKSARDSQIDSQERKKTTPMGMLKLTGLTLRPPSPIVEGGFLTSIRKIRTHSRLLVCLKYENEETVVSGLRVHLHVQLHSNQARIQLISYFARVCLRTAP
ncbi:hypothetical protein BJ508DRAFT_310393 [Ascobolus immersus RN42]|uniref:Uncharacterized protein n=1 Tax=Ascobolus immersus RN42 TaxID=1160509 RepID=A0A3N4HXJ9_ASCIM|nr:hypothetical protein BJ508DRAFT_310393 [Ascobolus immersus RN42]